MTNRVKAQDSRRREIVVAFAAGDEVADVDRLCGWLRGEIEQHLLSITEVPLDGWDLRATIEQCRMSPHDGAVRLALNGAVAGRPIDQVFAVSDEPKPAGLTLKEHADEATKVAFANAFTFFGRLLVPSELVKALGRRRISGRLIRAWHDCCREIRISIDATVNRPDSGGLRTLRKTVRNAALSGLGFTAMSVALKLLLRTRQRDEFTAWMGCGFLGIGVFGAIAASGLLLLPARFYQCERPGLELVRLFGVKTLGGIRFVAGGLLLLAVLAFLVPGLWWRFFN
ncbi:MAG: hypothetical protein ACKOSQ_05785 [Planctomycetaceae bacterium]